MFRNVCSTNRLNSILNQCSYRKMSTESAKKFDLVVIGCGSGGIATARRAASYGAKVAIIEQSVYGGSCVNVGCVPKKVMWSAAAVGHAVDDAEEYAWDGVDISNKKFNWSKMKTKRDAYIRRLNGIYYNNLVRDNITIYRGQATFSANNELTILPSEQDLKTIDGEFSAGAIYLNEPIKMNIGEDGEASKVIIACGGAPTKLSIPGGEYARDSNDFFWDAEQPKKALVVGAGYIAVELAHILHTVGTDTTLTVRKQCALREFDDIISSTLWTQLTEKTPGLKALNYHTPKEIIKRDDGLFDVVFTTNDGEVTLSGFDTIYSAVGRTPGVTVGLSNTSINLDKRGCTIVDDMGLTSLPNVYAVGDILGKSDLTPVAINAGRRLADYLFGGKPRLPLSYDNIPTVVFTYPPIGVVGLTEEQAREKYGDAVKVYKSTFTPMYYSMLTNKGTCAMKLIVQGEEERIVGIHMMGLGVDEMLQGFAVCVKLNLKKSEMDSVVAIHPTASEEMVLFR